MAKPVLILLLSVLLVSCTEKTIIMPVDGSVSGYLRPAVGGAMIRTADSSVTTFSRDDGFFLLQPVPPGTQDIVIDAEGFSRRHLHEIIVFTGRTFALGPVTLSRMPYPIFDVDPADGANRLSTTASIYLSCDERLDFALLTELAVISPSIAGTWYEFSTQYPGGEPLVYRYSFLRTGYFDLNTAYTITIPGTMKTLSGIPLGQPIVIHFTTAPLTAYITIKAQNGSPPVVDLLTPDLRVQFNGEVHIDSLRKAVLIDPPVEGIWVATTGNPLSGYFGFVMPTGGYLRPNTNYAVLVEDDVVLSGSHRLGDTALRIFVTNGFEITNPSSGSSRGVAADGAAAIYFNIPADTAATTAAISIRRSNGSSVSFATDWTGDLRRVNIKPTEGWDSDETYKVIIASHARSVEGSRLSYQHEFYVSTY